MRRIQIVSSLALLIAVAHLSAQSAATPHATGPSIAITYTPQRSIVTGSGAGFWLQGGAVDAALPLHHDISIAASLATGHTAATTATGSGLTLFTFVAGPRYTFSSIPYLHDSKASKDSSASKNLKPSIFVEGLIGFAHGSASVFPAPGGVVNSGSSFALLTGGGVDLPLRSHIGLRLVQADYVRSTLPNGAGDVQNSFRLGTGILFDFE